MYFKDVKIGDRVYSEKHGQGTVSQIFNTLAIGVEFDCGKYRSYYTNGKYSYNDSLQSLFYNNGVVASFNAEDMTIKLKHSCDYDNCHYMLIDGKYYRLGFREEETGVYPTPMEEIKPEDMDVLLQEEFGYITTTERIEIQNTLAQVQEEEQKVRVKDLRHKQYMELKKEFEGE